MKNFLLILLFIVSANNLHAQLFVSTQLVNPRCHGESNGLAIVNVSGGTAPYIFTWSNGVISSSDTLGNLAAGNYYITVTDAGTETAVDSLTLMEPPPMGLIYTTAGDTVCEGTVAGVYISATNISDGPYAFNNTLNGITSPNQFSGDFYLSKPGDYIFMAISNSGCTDTFQLTIPACAGYTGMADVENPATNIKLYPNPVIDMLNISSSLPIEHMNIYAADGTLLLSKNNPTNKIETGPLPAGGYLAEIRMGAMQYRIKWVKL